MTAQFSTERLTAYEVISNVNSELPPRLTGRIGNPSLSPPRILQPKECLHACLGIQTRLRARTSQVSALVHIFGYWSPGHKSSTTTFARPLPVGICRTNCGMPALLTTPRNCCMTQCL